jgi:hypothetical protein
VAFRAVQLDTLWVASTGHTITLEQRYETLRDNRWTTIVTARASSWSYDRVPSGLTAGWAYELRDGSDKVLTSDTESWIAIASGGSTEASAAELCALKQKAIVADQQAAVSKLYFAADAVPVPDEVTMDIDIKIYGFGISIGGKKNMDAAANLKEVGDDNAVKAGAGFELDGRLHPGKYFPEQFAPEPGELELVGELEGFQSPFGETDLAAAGPCPSSTTGAETVDMGGGSVARPTCAALARSRPRGAANAPIPRWSATCSAPARTRAQTNVHPGRNAEPTARRLTGAQTPPASSGALAPGQRLSWRGWAL